MTIPPRPPRRRPASSVPRRDRLDSQGTGLGAEVVIGEGQRLGVLHAEHRAHQIGHRGRAPGLLHPVEDVADLSLVGAERARAREVDGVAQRRRPGVERDDLALRHSRARDAEAEIPDIDAPPARAENRVARPRRGRVGVGDPDGGRAGPVDRARRVGPVDPAHHRVAGD
jgi:hypothetical protein